MEAYIEKDSLMVGELVDFIKEMNIDKNNKVLHDAPWSNSINSFKILNDIRVFDVCSNSHKDFKEAIVFTDDSNATDLNKSLLVSDFLKYAKQVDRDSLIIYHDNENNLYVSVFSAYREENTHNLALQALDY